MGWWVERGRYLSVIARPAVLLAWEADAAPVRATVAHANRSVHVTVRISCHARVANAAHEMGGR